MLHFTMDGEVQKHRKQLVANQTVSMAQYRVPAQPIVKELIFMIRDVEMIGKRMDDVELWR